MGVSGQNTEVAAFNTDWGNPEARKRGGGFFRISWGLANLYKDSLVYRNRWSVSNAGFDLAQYLGCVLTFVPDATYDYVVVVERDFPAGYTGGTEERPWCQPGILLTHPHHMIILSFKNGGNRRKLPKIRIPPPSALTNKWMTIKDMAQQALVRLIGCFLTFDDPWAPSELGSTVDAWWGDINWLKNFGNNAYLQQTGPFVVKTMQRRGSMTLLYKFYFRWGGVLLYPQPVPDPTKVPPVPTPASGIARGLGIATDPRDADNFLSFPGDWSPGGTPSEGVLRRLMGYFDAGEREETGPKFVEGTEAEEEDYLGDSEEESENESAPRPLRPMGFQHRRRDRVVRRIRQLIRMVVQEEMDRMET